MKTVPERLEVAQVAGLGRRAEQTAGNAGMSSEKIGIQQPGDVMKARGIDTEGMICFATAGILADTSPTDFGPVSCRKV